MADQLGHLLPGEGAVDWRLHGNRSAIRDVVRDPQNDGLLWLATGAGVARLDSGSGDWTFLDRSTGLSAQDVEGLFLDSDNGELWAVGWMGISVLSRGESTWAVLSDDVYQMSRRHVTTVVGDPADREALWFLTPEGVFRFHRRSGAWQWVGLPEPALSVVPLDRGKLWAVVTEQGLYQLDPRNGAIHLRLPADEARRVIGEPADGSYGIRLRAATALGGQQVAVSTVSDGVFFFDLATGELRYPPFNQGIVGDCTTPDLHRAGSRWLLYGGAGCWGELSPSLDELRPLPPLPTAEIRAFETDAREPDLLWIGTSRGLLRFDLRNGDSQWHLPPGAGPGTHGWDLEVVAEKLYFASSDGVLGSVALESTNSEWQRIDGLCRPLGLFPAPEDRLLVLGGIECLGQPELWTFSTGSLAYEPLPLPWNDLISYPYDIVSRADYLWMIGPIFHDGPFALAALSVDEEKLLHLGVAPGIQVLLPSILDPEAMWLASGGVLMRVEAESFAVEQVREGIGDAGVLADGRLWIQAESLAVVDPRDRSVTPLPLTGRPIADPNDPDRLWLLEDGRLSAATISTGRADVAVDLPANLQVRDLRQTSTGWARLWLSTSEGLLEIRRRPPK